MPATASGSSFDANVRTAIGQIQQEECRYDHIILATVDGSMSRSAPFQLIGTAAGGLDALRAKLRARETRFALLRVQARLLLIVSLGQDLTGLQRAQALVQGRGLQSTLGAALFAAVTIAHASQLTSAVVGSKLQLAGFTHIDSPSLTQDFRASWSSTSAVSTTSRAKPSAPSSPEEAGHGPNWSRPASDIGPSYRSETDALSTSTSSRAKSFHSSMLDKFTSQEQLVTRHNGIVIDLESVVEGSRHDDDVDRSERAPTPPPKTKLPPLPISVEQPDDCETEDSSLATPLASAWNPTALQRPFQPRNNSDPGPCGPVASPLRQMSAEEQKCLSDERDRIRVDETIRQEVMRKLQAEQQATVNIAPKSPANRMPRVAISPPLAPPPPFALPPAPPSPSAAAIASMRPSGIGSPRLPNRRRHHSGSKPCGTATIDTLPEAARAAPSRPPSNSTTDSDDIGVSTASLGEAQRTSESHESIRSSIQSLRLWEYAESASQRSSFLSLPGHSISSKVSENLSQMKRASSGSVSPNIARSRQVSCSSVTPIGANAKRCTASSSTGSVAASSIFDKDLPAPPTDSGNTSAEGEEWTGALGSPDSMEVPLAPWADAILPSGKAEKSAAQVTEEAKMQDLRERLALAEARAKAAEEAASVAVQEAQSETKRLADELAKVERGTRDKMEAEAVRRAKWAREQVARDQLDAYERSKLEADEKRRRRAIEEQRQLECDRANRIREEQEWREQEAERVKHEYEVKIQHLVAREAKLKAEAEAKDYRERERIEQEEARATNRRQRLVELKRALEAEGRADEAAAVPLSSGWLNLQMEGTTQWKRRWYQVVKRELVLSRSPTDTSLLTKIPLDPDRLTSAAENHEDCTMSHTVRFEVLLDADAELQLEEAPRRRATHLISTDTHSAKEEIELIIEAIATL